MLFSTWTASSQTFYSVPIEPTRTADASTRAIKLAVFDLTRNFTGELVHQEEAYTDHYRGQSARGLILFSRTFKWNTHQDHVALFYPLVMESQVCVQEDLCVQHKGSMHWLNRCTKLILSFDVEKELFFTTPARIPSDESCGRLLNLGGRLALIGFTTETVLWTSDDDLAQDWNQEIIKMEDDEAIDPLSNPISDCFLTWPSPNASDNNDATSPHIFHFLQQPCNHQLQSSCCDDHNGAFLSSSSFFPRFSSHPCEKKLEYFPPDYNSTFSMFA